MRKLRVLGDLRECQEAFSGISVDTCRIFKLFNELDIVEQVGGLLISQSNILSFSKKLEKSLETGDSYLRQSEYLKALNLDQNTTLKQKVLSTIWNFSNRLSPAWLLQRQFALYPISKKHYQDFIWQLYFAEKMDISEKECLLRASFFGTNISYGLAKARMNPLLPNLQIDTSNWDIFFSSTPINVKVSKSTKKVIRYHDAIPIFYPHLTPNPPREQYIHLKQCTIEKQTSFVCNSLNTLDELVTLFPKVEARASVIPCSVSDKFYKVSQPLQIEEILSNYSYSGGFALKLKEQSLDIQSIKSQVKLFSGRYVIAVSTIDPRKNYTGLIQAWAEVRAKIAPDLNLVIIGRVGWNSEKTMRLVSQYVNQGSLIHLTGVPFTELRILLSNAMAYVFPTLAEGFGIPAIEAMRCGCPTIVSSIKVMRETCGDASLFVNPYDIQEIADAISRLVKDSPESDILRQDLVKKGYQQSEKYTFSSIQQQWSSYFESLFLN